MINLVVLWLANLTISDHQRRLELLATTDRLAGQLYSTAINPLFGGLTQAALRLGEALSALLVDINHVETINDGQGHPSAIGPFSMSVSRWHGISAWRCAASRCARAIC